MPLGAASPLNSDDQQRTTTDDTATTNGNTHGNGDDNLPPAPASPPRQPNNTTDSPTDDVELKFRVCQCPEPATATAATADSRLNDLHAMRLFVHRTNAQRPVQLRPPRGESAAEWLPMRVVQIKRSSQQADAESERIETIHQCDTKDKRPIRKQPTTAHSDPAKALAPVAALPKSMLKKQPAAASNSSNSGSTANAAAAGSNAAASAGEIIIISDEFRRQAGDRQEVHIDHKRKWLKLMKLQREQMRQQRLHEQLRLHREAVELAGRPHSTSTSFAQKNHSRAVSVPTVSRIVAHDDIGLHRATTISSQQQQQQHRQQLVHRKQLVIVSDDFRRDACRQTDGVVVIVDDAAMSRRRQRQLQQMRRDDGSRESSVDDVGHKIAGTAFRSYDEDEEDLERKQLGGGAAGGKAGKRLEDCH